MQRLMPSGRSVMQKPYRRFANFEVRIKSRLNGQDYSKAKNGNGPLAINEEIKVNFYKKVWYGYPGYIERRPSGQIELKHDKTKTVMKVKYCLQIVFDRGMNVSETKSLSKLAIDTIRLVRHARPLAKKITLILGTPNFSDSRFQEEKEFERKAYEGRNIEFQLLTSDEIRDISKLLGHC